MRFSAVRAIPALSLLLAGPLLAGPLLSSIAMAQEPRFGDCAIFPPDNPWNQDVSAFPVDPGSDAYIAAMTADGGFLHPDFGENQDYGLPYVAVAGQPPVPVSFDYADESDPGPYPIPSDAPIEAGDDHHVLVVDLDTCILYELFDARPDGEGWSAGSGAVFDLSSNELRPTGWTSADAAGLPILPGLVRYEEVEAGAINHALRVTFPATQQAFIPPATHYASDSTDPSLPPMGLRLRLRADYDFSGFTGQARVILEALQRYGLIVADNGSPWFISGATSPGWNDEDLSQLRDVPGEAFEVVTTGELIRRGDF